MSTKKKKMYLSLVWNKKGTDESSLTVFQSSDHQCDVELTVMWQLHKSTEQDKKNKVSVETC